MIQSFFILRTQHSTKLLILDLLSDLHQLNTLHMQDLNWRAISEGGNTPGVLTVPPREGGCTYFDADAADAGFAAAGVGQQDVLGFQVPVDDAFAVQDPHGCCNLLQEHSDGVLTQSPLSCQ